MQQKTFTATAGPVVTAISSMTGVIRAIVVPGLTQARVTVRTADDSGRAADAVAGAEIRQDGRLLSVVVPPVESGNTSFNNGSTVFQSFGTVHRGEEVVGMVIDGDFNVAGGTEFGQPRTGKAASEIDVLLELPEGSDLGVRTELAATISAGGALRNVDLKSGVGSVVLDRVVGELTAKTGTGSILVRDYAGTRATLKTGVGTIDVHVSNDASGDLSAMSGVGNVAVRGATHLRVSAKSSIGRVTR
ncbi:hypothetical protein [Kitasatospora sp. NPDC002965]|uniref:hypothetical protein n=1 Tax=Kitasatospora sp. NPDC002965 TaxID=3154775 RepID=UPI0033B18791